MYISYTEYQNMGGTLDESSFNEYEFEARTIVDWYTFNRLQKDTEFPEAVQRCMYELIKLAKLKADAMMLGSQTTQTTDSQGNVTTITTNATIASQSNDGVSISYNTVSASEVFNALQSQAQGNVLETTVKRYLQGVTNQLGRKLLYRGIYEDE